MGPSPESLWLIIAYALAAIGAGWLLSTMFSNDRPTRIGNIVGSLGAGIAALGLAAALNPVPGITAKEILGMWTISLGMIVIAIVMVAQNSSQLRWFLVASGVVCLLLNVGAIAVLLWIATVSAGGV